MVSNSEKSGYGSHRYGSWVIDVNPTGKQEGSRHRDCVTCGYRETETIPATGEHEHAWSTSWSHNGSHHWHECSAAGCTIVSNSKKDSYGSHSYGDWVIDVNAASTKEGRRHRDCVICGFRQTKTIPATGEHKHTWSTSWSHNGSRHWHECSAAGCTIASNRKKGGYGSHNYGNWVIDVKATGTQEGSRHRDCVICGYRQTESIPATGEHEHKWFTGWSYDGGYHWHECDAAGCPIVNNGEKSSYGSHSYGDWVIDANATSTQRGSRHRNCAICGYRQTEDIPVTGTGVITRSNTSAGSNTIARSNASARSSTSTNNTSSTNSATEKRTEAETDTDIDTETDIEAAQTDNDSGLEVAEQEEQEESAVIADSPDEEHEQTSNENDERKATSGAMTEESSELKQKANYMQKTMIILVLTLAGCGILGFAVHFIRKKPSDGEK